METNNYFEYLKLCKPDSILKLQVEVIDEEDGSGTIRIDWDETDPELEWWTSMGEELQQQFILDALDAACDNILSEEV